MRSGRAAPMKSVNIPKGAKKARKSAALIIAEKDIAELKNDVKELKSWIVASIGTAFLTLLAAVGALVAPFFTRGH